MKNIVLTTLLAFSLFGYSYGQSAGSIGGGIAGIVIGELVDRIIIDPWIDNNQKRRELQSVFEKTSRIEDQALKRFEYERQRDPNGQNTRRAANAAAAATRDRVYAEMSRKLFEPYQGQSPESVQRSERFQQRMNGQPVYKDWFYERNSDPRVQNAQREVRAAQQQMESSRGANNGTSNARRQHAKDVEAYVESLRQLSDARRAQKQSGGPRDRDPSSQGDSNSGKSSGGPEERDSRHDWQDRIRANMDRRNN